MDKVYNELTNQIIKLRNSSPKLHQIELQFRLGYISTYNQPKQEKQSAIQPLYYKLPNGKIVKHHQFLAQLEESDFNNLLNKLKEEINNYSEQHQIDYIYADESKLTLEIVDNVRQIVKQMKKQPLIQDIDIVTSSKYDTRFSCKRLTNVEINTQTMQPQLQRNKHLFTFKPIYYSATNSIDVICSIVSRNTGGITQDIHEVEVKTLIFANQKESEIFLILKDLYQILDRVINMFS